MSLRKIILASFLLFFLPAGFLEAQELYNGDRGVFEAKVLNVLDQEMRLIPGTDTEHLYQTIEALVLTGPEEGEVIVFENDYLTLKEGNRFYLNTFVDFEGLSQYSVVNINRSYELLFLLSLFIFTVLFFGGWQGVRSLLALFGSFFNYYLCTNPRSFVRLEPFAGQHSGGGGNFVRRHLLYSWFQS